MTLGVQLLPFQIDGTTGGVDRMFADLTASGADAIIAAGMPDPAHQHLAELASRFLLPLAGDVRSLPDSGALLSYGSVNDATPANYRRLAYFVDHILRGAKPADLPIEQPSTYQLIVNNTAVQKLGLSIPPSVAAQVTEWVQ
jgi:putative tryptophan/tyrosine transport system substrate-binding protein